MSDKLRSPEDKEDVLFDLAKLEKMASEPRDLKDDAGTVISDLFDLVFGAGMIIAPLAVVIMMICAKAGRGVYLATAIPFVFCFISGVMIVKDAWRNLTRKDKNG